MLVPLCPQLQAINISRYSVDVGQFIPRLDTRTPRDISRPKLWGFGLPWFRNQPKTADKIK